MSQSEKNESRLIFKNCLAVPFLNFLKNYFHRFPWQILNFTVKFSMSRSWNTTCTYFFWICDLLLIEGMECIHMMRFDENQNLVTWLCSVCCCCRSSPRLMRCLLLLLRSRICGVSTSRPRGCKRPLSADFPNSVGVAQVFE